MLRFYAGHPWIQEDGVALDKPLDSAVLSGLKQFSAMNKLKKMALRVITFLCDITLSNESIFLSLGNDNNTLLNIDFYLHSWICQHFIKL